MAWDSDGAAHSLHELWGRRQATKFNGVSYPVQKAAAAVYSPEGQKEARALSDYYMGNAAIILEKLRGMGYSCSGGENAPYIWVATGRDSWEFFDAAREGRRGDHRDAGSAVRRPVCQNDAFNKREKVVEAMRRSPQQGALGGVKPMSCSRATSGRAVTLVRMMCERLGWSRTTGQ
jgi:LL-diaminopimelate aminotransferase